MKETNCIGNFKIADKYTIVSIIKCAIIIGLGIWLRPANAADFNQSINQSFVIFAGI